MQFFFLDVAIEILYHVEKLDREFMCMVIL